jgi:glycosyltransferase involved in cell wall biosynthesis
LIRRERVLVASTSYPSHAGDPSGHFVRTEALELARSGAEVHLLAPCPMRDPELAAHALGGSDLFSWPGAIARASENPLRLAALAGVAERAARFFARAPRFDRACFHFLVPVAFPSVELLRGCNDVEAVAHGADVRLLVRAPSALRRAIVRRLLARARIRFVAHHLLERLSLALDAETRALLSRSATVRPAAIDLGDRIATAAPPPESVPRDYAVWVGRDVREKRLDVALAAAEAAGVHLVVVGANAPRLGRNARATFLGKVGRPDALAWIAGARVMLSTSESEGAPTAVREARALGIPVIACDAGDLARWAATDRGISICARDASALARAVRAHVTL